MEINKFIDVWPGIYLFDFLRYTIPASIAFLLFWVIGKKRWQHLFIQGIFPKASQLWMEFKYSMSTVGIFSMVGFGIYTSEQAGFTQIYDDPGEYGWGYFFISLLIMIIFHDFYFYWTHRFMHHKSIFKYVHRVHHLSTNPSPWAAYSFHPLEAIVQALVLPILIFIIPVHVLNIFLFTTYMIVRNVLGHLGFEIFPKGFVQNKLCNWHTTVTHHNMHHKYFECNYGLYFSWWDHIMGTTHNKYEETFDEVKSRPRYSKQATSSELRARSLEQQATRNKLVALSIIIMFPLTTGSAQSVSGKWMTYNEESGSPLSIIEIRETGKSIEGKVEKIFLEPFQGEDPICTKCNGIRKDQKVIGMNFMWGFKSEGNFWSSGKILDPESGEIYNSKMWLENDSTLKIRGYGGIMNLFYRTQTWKREGTSNGKNPVGIWFTIDDTWNKVKSQVEIIEKDGELLGYIRKIFLLPHEGTDPVCIECEGKLKNSKIVGMKILYGFKWNGEKWQDGKILDPGNGNTYLSSLWLIDADTLKVRGYLGPFYRSQIWKRVKNESAFK